MVFINLPISLDRDRFGVQLGILLFTGIGREQVVTITRRGTLVRGCKAAEGFIRGRQASHWASGCIVADIIVDDA